MRCLEIEEIFLNYEYASKVKPRNIPSYFNEKYGVYVYSDYKLQMTKNDIKQFSLRHCQLIDKLKHITLYEEKNKPFLAEKIVIKKQDSYMFNLTISFHRKKDYTHINVLWRNLYFGSGYVKYLYASDVFYDNPSMQKQLILFANEIVLYKNEQIKKDTTIVDSLKMMYPLINYDSL